VPARICSVLGLGALVSRTDILIGGKPRSRFSYTL
jgi:hypothetical protein